MITSKYRGPKPMRDKEGFVVIEFGQFPDCEELAPDFTVSVLGWGSQLLATGTDRAELATFAKNKYGGKVRVAVGEECNPLNMEQAKW